MGNTVTSIVAQWLVSGVALLKDGWVVGGGRVATGLKLEKRHSEAPLAQAISQTSEGSDTIPNHVDDWQDSEPEPPLIFL